jgi:hypothetical protein
MAKLLKLYKICFPVVLVFIACGCFPITNAYKRLHMPEASLSWYVYESNNDADTNIPKKEYQKKIGLYLEVHSDIKPEIADKMKACRVGLGMSEEQVLAMVEPQYVLKGKNKKEEVFKYSNIGKFESGKLPGEGNKVWVTLTDGVVTDITEVDLMIGY